MCGRYSIGVFRKDMEAYLSLHYGIEGIGEGIVLPRYNVAPGQMVPAVINDGTKYRFGLFKWGYLPFYAKNASSQYTLINAKAETLAEKTAFRASFESRRCVLFADGFYEWMKEDRKKSPMRIVLKAKAIFPIAGLWTTYTAPDGTKTHTCVIITTTPNSVVAPIHDRMPVILTEESKDVWLDPTIKDPEVLKKVLVPYPGEDMFAYRVPPIVNNATLDTPECILEF